MIILSTPSIGVVTKRQIDTNHFRIPLNISILGFVFGIFYYISPKQ